MAGELPAGGAERQRKILAAISQRPRAAGGRMLGECLDRVR